MTNQNAVRKCDQIDAASETFKAVSNASGILE